jgi:uncharacterized membrane protein
VNLDLPIGVVKALSGLLILGSGVWIGGFVAITVFNASSKKALGRPERIALFRELGRRYLKVAGVALVLVAVPGAVLLADRPADPFTVAVLALALALIVVTWIGVKQARSMTRLRKAGLAHPEDATHAAAIERASRAASVLRAGIGLLSLVLFAVAVAMAG